MLRSVFGCSQKVVLSDLGENSIGGSRKTRRHTVVRSNEDGKVETIVRQSLGSFSTKEKEVVW